MLLDAFLWLGTTPPGVFLNKSTLAFAFVQSAHLLGIAALAGAVVATDLAAIGVVFRETPPASIARGARRIFWSALALAGASGVLLVSAGPFKYYSNPLFPWKIAVFALALVLHLVLLRTLEAREERPGRRLQAFGAASLAGWLAVLVLGRWVGLI